ncbi:MAG TPA: nucleotidyltransferase domain-containing protein [Candidatus Babeliales bacterium]|jgi:predicted nucleotidyltransferase|nr:nucleotidyltransferase domain-containing protein [Candidatus Babeliales bacterium]
MKQDIHGYQFFKKLIALPYIEKIILYGSRARGDTRDRSDIDLAIECPLLGMKVLLCIIEILYE